MPLGLLPGMRYEEHEAAIAPGEALLLYCDGVTEAHAAEREMFGTPRLVEHVADRASGDLIDGLLTSSPAALHGRRTGSRRTTSRSSRSDARSRAARKTVARPTSSSDGSRFRATAGNEREAMQRVARGDHATRARPAAALERSAPRSSEAAMNAIEHGNQGRAELPVEVEVVTTGGELDRAHLATSAGRPAGDGGRVARPRGEARRAAEARAAGASS